MGGAEVAIWGLRLGGNMLGDGLLQAILSWARFLRFVWLAV